MLNRAPAPPYGFTISVHNAGALLVLSTAEFPIEKPDDEKHHTGGDGLIQPATDLGLHLVNPDLDPAPPRHGRQWTFSLPTGARRGGVVTDKLNLVAEPGLEITRGWWNAAVMAGGFCRFLTTTGLIARAVSPNLHPEVVRAHGGHRLVGAALQIEF